MSEAVMWVVHASSPLFRLDMFTGVLNIGMRYLVATYVSSWVILLVCHEFHVVFSLFDFYIYIQHLCGSQLIPSKTIVRSTM